MNRKPSGIVFASMLLGYVTVMAFSYTSCNSDSNSTQASTTSATDSSNMTPADTTAKMASAAKKKKGKAMVESASANNKSSKLAKDKDGIYMNPEKMPEFSGGQIALSKYMEDNLNYPQQALDDNKKGTVRISFVVDENGNVLAPAVMGNKLGDGLDEEAIDLIKKMPKWKPGTVKGKNVRTRLDLPVTFQIADES